MRNKITKLAILVAAGALVSLAGPVWASDTPFSCTTDNQGWTVTASTPRVDDCTVCDENLAGQDCSIIHYEVAPLLADPADHIAILINHDLTIVGNALQQALPCDGDPTIGLGELSCHESAVKVNADGQVNKVFDLCVLGGEIGPVARSIAVKKGRTTESCAIASFGTDVFVDPNAQGSAQTTVEFKGCTVTIPENPVTGVGGEATISGGKCKFLGTGTNPNPGLPIAAAQLNINGVNVGAGSYGVGSLSSGTDSCSTKIVKRKLYTFCTCADNSVDAGGACTTDPCAVCDNCCQ